MQLLKALPLFMAALTVASPIDYNSTDPETAISQQPKLCGTIWHVTAQPHNDLLYAGSCHDSYPGKFTIKNCVCLFTNDPNCKDHSKIQVRAGGAFPLTGETKAKFYMCAG